MISLKKIRKSKQGILAIGLHEHIIQSVLDFDYACGKSEPSILGVVGNNRTALKLFFGSKEIVIPVYAGGKYIPPALAERVQWMLNTQSGRRMLEGTQQFFAQFPRASGGHLFAENVPEAHALTLVEQFGATKLVAGPSGVGLLVPGHLKLGAIGGTDPTQLCASTLATPGSVAVISTSGGMTNELIRVVTSQGKRVSFAISIGGDRFPVTALRDVLLLAEDDAATLSIVYFGELGGTDEYEIVKMRLCGELTKPIITYVAGIIDEAFEDRQQFGHAKALVTRQDESARAKRAALRDSGATVPLTFEECIHAIAKLPQAPFSDPNIHDYVFQRTPSILSTRKIVDIAAIPDPIRGKKRARAREYALAHVVLSALIGKKVSDDTAALFEHIFELLIDHGGEVSGAVNTMITARAGRDLVSSLSAGLLTVGPRFGGAVNDAARQWIDGVEKRLEVRAFIEQKTAAGVLLAGIGHKKYRIGVPDPRVDAIASFASLLKEHPHYDFARSIEAVTTGKNGKLILNVDGVMAALMLDMLREKEGYTPFMLRELLTTEFFNALFVIPRSVGFIAHFMEQKKHDEGLFRLPSSLLFTSE